MSLRDQFSQETNIIFNFTLRKELSPSLQQYSIIFGRRKEIYHNRLECMKGTKIEGSQNREKRITFRQNTQKQNETQKVQQ